jgi:hypothetical protein
MPTVCGRFFTPPSLTKNFQAFVPLLGLSPPLSCSAQVAPSLTPPLSHPLSSSLALPLPPLHTSHITLPCDLLTCHWLAVTVLSVATAH